MSESSRRGFLKVAGAGVAVAGVAAVTSHATANATAAPEAVALPRTASGSMVVHVHDVRSGKMSLMVEGHEITITDRELAARIASALHKNSPRAVNNAAV